jgi:hypothetical protein
VTGAVSKCSSDVSVVKRLVYYGGSSSGLKTELAHDLWQQHGWPMGRDEEFWVRAERELVESTGSH